MPAIVKPSAFYIGLENTFDETRFIKGIINICILMNYMRFYQPLLSIIPNFRWNISPKL